MEPALEKRLGQPALKHCERLNSELDELNLPEGELDAVVIVLFYHDTYWQKTDRKKMNAQILKSLKPGGVYGVIDHHAEAGSKDRDVNTTHRVDASIVKEEILAAGFTLEAESDVLSHPEDDRTKNVFDPTIRGNTDRFVYKFRKPVD
jgi:predicted methyltransferase